MPSMVEIGPVVRDKKIFKFRQCIYAPKDAGLNWPNGSGIEHFLNFVNILSLIRNYLPLKKGVALHLNKLKFPPPKDAKCQVWLKLTQGFLKGIFFKMSSLYFCYFVLVIISP